ncbi:hypothetical protein V6N11_076806 [Hibiscus sabdariffa]|uniref:Uncharacterized protein n=1 Tax=Hibiscus sabdariffa TaxID=183260 RepID=A0ABR2P9H4_9ROSI
MVNLRTQGQWQFVEEVAAWDTLFPTICCQLWKRRCVVIMDMNYVDSGDIRSKCTRIAFAFAMSAVSRLGHRLNVHHGNDLSNGRIWNKPRRGWVKANVNGTCNLVSNNSTAGEVIRDEHGVWFIGFYRSLGA